MSKASENDFTQENFDRMRRELRDLKVKVEAQAAVTAKARELHAEVVKRYVKLSANYNTACNRLAEVEVFWLNRQVDVLALGDLLNKWRFRPVSWAQITAASGVKPPGIKSRKRKTVPTKRTHHTVEEKLTSLI